jgi:hypothetical protein
MKDEILAVRDCEVWHRYYYDQLNSFSFSSWTHKSYFPSSLAVKGVPVTDLGQRNGGTVKYILPGLASKLFHYSTPYMFSLPSDGEGPVNLET